MPKWIDITNKRFGRLTALYKVYTKNKQEYWMCKCDCGNTKIINKHNLMCDLTKSCGCLGCEIRQKFPEGERETRLYRIWTAIKERCYNCNSTNYKNYGGRGIIVCDEWKGNYLSFRAWALNNGYNDNLTIDRIDVNGNYEPENCRWATNAVQQRNKRTNHNITYNGETHCIKEWAEILGVPKSKLYSRIKRYGEQTAIDMTAKDIS